MSSMSSSALMNSMGSSLIDLYLLGLTFCSCLNTTCKYSFKNTFLGISNDPIKHPTSDQPDNKHIVQANNLVLPLHGGPLIPTESLNLIPPPMDAANSFQSGCWISWNLKTSSDSNKTSLTERFELWFSFLVEKKLWFEHFFRSVTQFSFSSF